METKPISKPSWSGALRRELPKLNSHPRLAILGIGNELYGDDAAGVIAARRLQPALAGRKDLLVLDVGSVPENCTGVLRRFKPDAVIMLDAAQMNAEPGTLRCLGWRDLVGLDASTHTFPLSTLAQYLSDELGCKVLLVGIQPLRGDFDVPLSSLVNTAVDSLVQTLLDLLL